MGDLLCPDSEAVGRTVRLERRALSRPGLFAAIAILHPAGGDASLAGGEQLETKFSGWERLENLTKRNFLRT